MKLVTQTDPRRVLNPVSMQEFPRGGMHLPGPLGGLILAHALIGLCDASEILELSSPTPGSTIEVVACSGDSAPGAIGQFSSFFHNLLIDDGGRVGFMASVSDGASGSVKSAIVCGSQDNLELVAAQDDAVPGGGHFQGPFGQGSLGGFSMNRHGAIAFASAFKEPNGVNAEGIFTWDTTSGLELLTKSGNTASGGLGTITSLGGPMISDGGQKVFSASAVDPTACSTRAVLLAEGGSLSVPLATGAAAPSGDGTMAAFHFPVVSADGEVAVPTYFTGSPSRTGFILQQMGALQEAARAGAHHPNGTESFSNQLVRQGNLSLAMIATNAGGDCLYMRTIESTFGPVDALFLGDGTTQAEILRVGDIIPGTTDAVTGISDVRFNDAGTVALLVPRTDSDQSVILLKQTDAPLQKVDAADGIGPIFALELGQNDHLAFWTSDAIYRVLPDLSLQEVFASSSSSDGTTTFRPGPLLRANPFSELRAGKMINASGQVAFTVSFFRFDASTFSFTSGTAVAVWTPPAD